MFLERAEDGTEVWKRAVEELLLWNKMVEGAMALDRGSNWIVILKQEYFYE